MSIAASSESIRSMENDMVSTARRLEQTSKKTLAAVRGMSDWDDVHSAELIEVMNRVARLTAQPVERLEQAAPRLERLAEILDEYAGVSIGRR